MTLSGSLTSDITGAGWIHPTGVLWHVVDFQGPRLSEGVPWLNCPFTKHRSQRTYQKGLTMFTHTLSTLILKTGHQARRRFVDVTSRVDNVAEALWSHTVLLVSPAVCWPELFRTLSVIYSWKLSWFSCFGDSNLGSLCGDGTWQQLTSVKSSCYLKHTIAILQFHSGETQSYFGALTDTHLGHLVCSVASGTQVDHGHGRWDAPRREEEIRGGTSICQMLEKIEGKDCVGHIKVFHCFNLQGKWGRKKQVWKVTQHFGCYWPSSTWCTLHRKGVPSLLFLHGTAWTRAQMSSWSCDMSNLTGLQASCDVLLLPT